MFLNAKLEDQGSYQPHYSFFNHIRRSVGERVAKEYLERKFIPKLEKSTKNIFIRANISKGEALNYYLFNSHLREALYTLLFDENSHHDYFLELPMVEYMKNQIIIPQNSFLCFYECKDKIRIGKEEKERIWVEFSVVGKGVVRSRIRKTFNTKNEMLESLRKSAYVIPEDGLQWLFEMMTIFASHRYTPDALYLQCKEEGVKKLKIDELKPIPHSESNSLISSWKKVGELYFEAPIIKPKKIHVFEVKTSDPLNPTTYTPNQKKFINAISRNNKSSISLHIIYVPLENFVLLKGFFKVLVYEVM